MPERGVRAKLPALDEPTNLVAILFRKPDLAIRPIRNATWDDEGIGHGELANLPCRRDAADPALVLGVVGRIVNKPEVAIRSCNDTIHTADKLGHWELTNRAGKGDAPDPVVPTVEVSFAKPEVAVGTRRDGVGMIARGEQGELADRALEFFGRSRSRCRPGWMCWDCR